MTEEQRDNLLFSMNENLIQNDNAISYIKEIMLQEFSAMNKKIEQRDDLLIALTKEVACLRSDFAALNPK